jgi:hypothetical protein
MRHPLRLMKKVLATIATLLLCTSCVPSEVFSRSQQAIADQGYTNIQYQGYEWFACGQEDQFGLRYAATAPNGRRVTLAACSGWFKGVTIRTIN